MISHILNVAGVKLITFMKCTTEIKNYSNKISCGQYSPFTKLTIYRCLPSSFNLSVSK